eukprot:Polyplicarium_translucidae@DN3341_c0_g2_i4.p1
MSRRYDTRTTTFSPEGRLYQVEYAMEAINNASSTLGIVAADGVVIAADRLTESKLLDQTQAPEKIYVVDKHMICAVAGLTSDANILVHHARVTAQRHRYSFREPQPVEQLIVQLCDTKQSYTQFGGLRPFGVSFLFAGWDKHHGYQLYHTDPAGNYSGWRATAIGVNNQSAQTILKQEWEETLSLEESLDLAAKVLLKTMDTTDPSAERLEFSTVTKKPDSDEVVRRVLDQEEIGKLMKKAIQVQQES